MVFFAIPKTASSFKPRFKTVSIIPGIDTLAPERTEISNGFSLSPNLAFMLFSKNSIAFSTSPLINSIAFSFPNWLYSVQTSVVIVKPGGTGIPIKFISAKLAPLPPNRFFIVLFPSAVLLPNL